MIIWMKFRRMRVPQMGADRFLQRERERERERVCPPRYLYRAKPAWHILSREEQDALICALMDTIVIRETVSPALREQFVQAVRGTIHPEV